ncbi:type 4a pilus biogenesis protein PilO [Candidatus Saccharibacteria bacterium]|nr:type 4a pilus biogenesis protein PilO [Candidatus Saccharibacteria bacterium]
MIKLDSKRLRLLLLGVLALSIVGFFGVMLAGLSTLGSESKKMVDLRVQSETADAQLSNLEQTKKDIEKYSYFKDVAKTVIPNDKDQAQAVLEINQMASQSGISIQSITFPASTLGLRTTTTPTQQDATSASSSSAAISQAKPVTGIPGLYSLELIITPESSNTAAPSKQVTYDKMLSFLHRIENNRHTAQITQVTIQPANGKTSLTFTLTINIFIKP